MADDRPTASLAHVEEAIGALLPIEREVLLMSAAERLSHDEIALRLGLSRAAVERHLANAIYKVDRRLERRGRPWWKFW